MPSAHHFEEVALGGGGGVHGSPSWRGKEPLRTDFSNPFIDPVVVAVSARRARADDELYFSWIRQAAGALTSLPEVRRVASYADACDPDVRSADGHVTLLLVGLASTSTTARQQRVIAVRAALARLDSALMVLDPSARVAVTGSAAADYDLNTWSAAGGDRAEKRALPLTLAILVLAFGTLVAASLPFLTGVATTTVSRGRAALPAEEPRLRRCGEKNVRQRPCSTCGGSHVDVLQHMAKSDDLAGPPPPLLCVASIAAVHPRRATWSHDPNASHPAAARGTGTRRVRPRPQRPMPWRS